MDKKNLCVKMCKFLSNKLSKRNQLKLQINESVLSGTRQHLQHSAKSIFKFTTMEENISRIIMEKFGAHFVADPYYI